ncbi:MAG: hypothetical protein KDB79_06590, partial [Acidobacteria bacterium]|nr:hypothetical protein [Acidobacteriota bacterium]
MRRIIFSVAVLCLLGTTAFGHISLIKGGHGPKSKQQTFKLEKVNGNIYALFGQGGNIGVSYGEDGLLTIDTQ